MIQLAPLQRESVAPFYQWLRDPEAIEYSLSTFQTLHTPQQIDDWFAATLQQQNCLNLGIYTEDTSRLIGYAGLTGISATNHAAEYFIFIGDKTWWGRGVGTEVTKQISRIGFTTYDLNRIMLTVSELNIGGVRAYAKAGFVVEGRLRQACCRQGAYHDKVVMSLLKAEWEQLAASD